MTRPMETANVTSFSTGLSQKGVRNHNERLLLTLLQRQGDLPGSDLAKLSGLSPPTVSAILKRLENDGLLLKGEPLRGKVGKPSVPMILSPDGVLSYGLKIGRRSAELLLMDITGAVRDQRQLDYASPHPKAVFEFLEFCLTDIPRGLKPDEVSRICGIGVAAPFEMWSWQAGITDKSRSFPVWHDVSITDEIHRFCNLPISLMNDATAACQAEQVFGRGKEFRDYAYFFVGAYVGGGIVLNHSVYEGRSGNAGALGSMPSVSQIGESMQLVDTASIHLLEKRLEVADLDPAIIWKKPQDWKALSRVVDPWLGQTAQELAKASLSTCSVIDFEAIIIDGAFPSEIRAELVERVHRYIINQDLRGLIPPRIEAGSVGGNARSIGAASRPIFSQFLLNTNAGLAVA